MPVSKWRSTQLSKVRPVHYENLKKRRVNQDNIKNSCDISNNKANSGQYEHGSFDEDYSNLNEKLADENEKKEKKRI